MPPLIQHSILQQSFAVIDQEIGFHDLSPEVYPIVRRVIHSTADFEFKHLVHCSHGAIQQGIRALQKGCPIVVDVSMLRQGVVGMVERTFNNPLLTAVTAVDQAGPGSTRTATGMNHCWSQATQGIFVIGNAPTALMALCDRIAASPVKPALVIGAPVGFIGVEAAKQRLAQLSVPQIRVDGRKGGSSVAAAILNALLVMAWEQP